MVKSEGAPASLLVSFAFQTVAFALLSNDEDARLYAEAKRYGRSVRPFFLFPSSQLISATRLIFMETGVFKLNMNSAQYIERLVYIHSFFFLVRLTQAYEKSVELKSNILDVKSRCVPVFLRPKVI